MRAFTISTLVSAIFASAAVAHTDCKSVDSSIIKHTGFSTGAEETHNGGMGPRQPPMPNPQH